ncbi:hypothetical protein SDC9_173356 [bioreactor metagenome]|uniref:Uncharacterized protein n=1 Tax=bioreactor metagenome TaxID=1076179 RepID=A0A645GGW4_9ZZZZ
MISDAEEFTLITQFAKLNHKAIVRRIQHSILDVMARGTAHREEGLAVYRKALPAHQLQDIVSYGPHVPAVPVRDGICLQQVVVFVVAVDE